MIMPHEVSLVYYDDSPSDKTSPHLDPPALVLHGDDLVVPVLPLSARRAYQRAVRPAKLLQEPVVFPAEVTGDEGARICQHVLVPQVRRQVSLAVRLPADEARLDRS